MKPAIAVPGIIRCARCAECATMVTAVNPEQAVAEAEPDDDELQSPYQQIGRGCAVGSLSGS